MSSTASARRQSPARARATSRYLAAQIAGAFGSAAGGTSGGLLAADLTGHAAAAPLPIGVFALGAAISGPALTRIMRRRGRTAGLMVGYRAAIVGASGVLAAAAIRSLPLLLIASVALGAGNSAVMLTRYVLADAASAGERGRAVSRSLLATTVGAVIGPNLLRPAASLATTIGLPSSSGLYIIALGAFITATCLLPGRADPEPAMVPTAQLAAPDLERSAQQRLAYVVLGTANAAMVSLMSLTGVHLRDHGYGLATIGLVVSLHVAGMFVGSPIIGRLCDGIGPIATAFIGTTLLVVVGAAGAVSGSDRIMDTAGLLLMLGVSWNIQVVAGSVLLTNSVPTSARPSAEGRAELVMGLAAGVGTLLGASSLASLGGFRLLSVAVAGLSMVTATRLGRSLGTT